ncbi:MAG: MFS transporter [Clostridia bacterium]|nr:MFS transporter [Clostridia bacterium]
MEDKDFTPVVEPESTEIAIDAAINEAEKADFLKDEVPPEERVPLKEKLAYACGALMDGGGVALMGCVMLAYMTDVLGIAAAIASTVMTVSKFWDAITDPVMGHITDNTRSRYGRRKPYMFIGGFLLILALFLLFAPIKEWGITSQSGMIAWVLLFYIFWNTCSTFTQVPYTSMASDISPSFRERNNANTIKLVFSAAAAGLAYLLPTLLLEQYKSHAMNGYVFWIVMVAVFGTLFGGGLIITGLFTKERIQPTTPKTKFDIKEFFKCYIKPFKNKSYRWHIVMYVSAFTCMDMLSALAVYYATHAWKGVLLFGMSFRSMFIIAPIMVAAVLAFPLVRIMMDKKGKAFAFGMGLPLYIIGGILLAVCDPSWCPPIVIPLAALIMGFGFGGAQMVPWMVFPDTLDVVELRTGERPTGNYSGIMTLVRKVSGALGVGIIGWILTGIGYDQYIQAYNGLQFVSGVDFAAIKSTELQQMFVQYADQISGAVNAKGEVVCSLSAAEIAAINVDGVLLTIRLLMGISIALLIGIALFASFRYKITTKKLIRVKYFLDHQHNGTVDQLTDEEKEEMEKLAKELCY